MIHLARWSFANKGVMICGMVALALPLAHAQQTSAHSLPYSKDLLETATRTAVTVSPDFDYEAYFWISDKQLLFVRPNPAHHQFRGVLVDAQTGEKVIPNEFNAFVSPRMPVVQNGTMSYEDSKKVIYLYPPP